MSALHAEWIKIRTLPSLLGTLCAMPFVTVLFSALADDTDGDALYSVYFGVNLGQIAAAAFGVTAVAADFRGGALRLWLAAVPHRGRWFAAKLTATALPMAAVGLLTGLLTLAAETAVAGTAADGPTTAQGLRGAVGCALYLMLMALLAAGLTAALRNGAAALCLLIPFLLAVSFVVGDKSGSVADFLPDRAGQAALHSTGEGALGPWTGLAVTALWAASVCGAGAWRLWRREA